MEIGDWRLGFPSFQSKVKKRRNTQEGKPYLCAWSVYDGLLDVEIHHHSMAFPDDFLNYLLFWKLIANSISV